MRKPWNDLTGESVDNGSSNLLQFTPDGGIIPDLALSYELADDAKSMMLTLRKGAKWSDGEPFTADDIVFVFEDMHWHPDVETWAILSGVTRVTKIDDYHVRYEMDAPYPVLEVQLSAWPGSQWVSFHPKHYLKKWHINHNADANKVAKEEGFEDWTRAFHYHFWWNPKTDIEQPTMLPWKFTDFTTAVRTYERNPYYFQVDAEGKQLPYIDTVVSTLVDPETYQLKAVSGEADIAFMNTSVDNWTLYKQNESSGGYTVIGVPGVLSADFGLALNQNHDDRSCGRCSRTSGSGARCRWRSTAPISTRPSTSASAHRCRPPCCPPRPSTRRSGVRPTLSTIRMRPIGCSTRWV